MSANKKINIVPESVFAILKGHGISKCKLESLMQDITTDIACSEMCDGDCPSNRRVLKLIALVQYLWNENVVLKERVETNMQNVPKKPRVPKYNTKNRFQCVKCGEWYPHSKVEVWDENPSVIRYICHRCQEAEGV
jgi:RNase P subunit RPR2